VQVRIVHKSADGLLAEQRGFVEFAIPVLGCEIALNISSSHWLRRSLFADRFRDLARRGFDFADLGQIGSTGRCDECLFDAGQFGYADCSLSRRAKELATS